MKAFTKLEKAFCTCGVGNGCLGCNGAGEGGGVTGVTSWWGPTSQIQNRHFLMPVQVSSSTACRVHEVFKGSSRTSDRDGKSFFHPEGKGVGKDLLKIESKQ